MKKVISLALAAVLALSLVSVIALTAFAGDPETPDVWDGTTIAEGFASGTGTEADPYVIKTCAQLAYLAKTVNVTDGKLYSGEYFRLDNDLDINGKVWDPIGATNACSFQGVFDGNGHTVSNYKVDDTTVDSALSENVRFGLFGVIFNTGVVKNLTVAGGDVETHAKASSGYEALFAGYLNGVDAKVENVVVASGKVYGTATSTGGLFGRVENGATVKNCVNFAEVTTELPKKGNAFNGGIVGCAGTGGDNNPMPSLINCINFGKVEARCPSDTTGKTMYEGGIVGCSGATGGVNVTGCVNFGAVLSDSQAGGITARTHTPGDVFTDCYNLSSNVNGLISTGLLIGWYKNVATVVNCKSVVIGEVGAVGTNEANPNYDGTGFSTADLVAADAASADYTLTPADVAGTYYLKGTDAKLIEILTAVFGDKLVKNGASSEETTAQGGEETTVPGGDETTVPGGEETTVPGGDETTVPGGDDTTVPGGDDTTVPGGDDTTVPGGDETTVPGGDDTTPAPSDDTTKKADDTTTAADEAGCAGCGSFGIAGLIVVIALGAAIVIKKK